MQRSMKRVAAITSMVALASTGLLGFTASAASASTTSSPINITFEDSDTTGYKLGSGAFVADFGGNVSSLDTAPPAGASGTNAAKIHIGDAAEGWSGTTFMKTTLDGAQGGTLFSAVYPYANIKVYSTTAGTMMLKMEGDCAATEIPVEHGGTGWETLHFENGSLAGCTTASFFPLFFEDGRQGKDVWIDDASFPGAETVDTPPTINHPSTLLTAEAGDANTVLTDFGGTASSKVAAPEGASTGDAVKIVAGGECWAGTTLASLATTDSLLSDGKTTVTANVYTPAAGARVRLKLEYSGDSSIFVEKDAISAGAGWNRLSWDLSTNYASASVYNKVSIFPGFSCGFDGETRVLGSYYVDDVAFNGATTPALSTAIKLSSPSKKVIAVTVAHAKGKTMTVSILGVTRSSRVIANTGYKTFKFTAPRSGTYKVTVTVGTTTVTKRVTTK